MKKSESRENKGKNIFPLLPFSIPDFFCLFRFFIFKIQKARLCISLPKYKTQSHNIWLKYRGNKSESYINLFTC